MSEKAPQGIESENVPGIDGLTLDFYKSLWSELGEDLLMVLSESLTEGWLPLSCRRAFLKKKRERIFKAG